jgi:hypothetical protein
VTTSPEWLDEQSAQVIQGQRAKADGAKVIATFTAGIAATLVGTTLQVHGSQIRKSDIYAAIMLGICGVLTVGVMFRDRVTEANHELVLYRSSLWNWSTTKELAELRHASMTAIKVNRAVLRGIKFWLTSQLIAALSTSAVATISILLGSSDQ